MNRVRSCLLAAVILWVAGSSLPGCLPRHFLAAQVVGILDDGMAAFEADDDLSLIETALPGEIKLLEALLVSSPNDRRALNLLSRLYASYAFAFLEPRFERDLLSARGCVSHPNPSKTSDFSPDREALSGYYLKGTEYALRSLQTKWPDWHQPITTTDQLTTLLQQLRPPDVPALFWYGFNLASYVRLNTDSIRIVSMAFQVPVVMHRVIALAPDYGDGLAHLVLLAYYARSPQVGGDPAEAKAHYEQLKKRTGPNFLLPDVFYARYYLQQQQDRSGFEQMLSAVLASPQHSSNFALLNQVARVRARLYQEAVDCLFL